MASDYIHHTDDEQLLLVADELLKLDPSGERWRDVIRHTYDVIYNGSETGRYNWDQLMKTEKTHFGTLFEIYAQRAFGFEGGESTDFRIAGIEVDAKWSQTEGAWMLPPEVFGKLALVATGDDYKSVWSLGLVRVSETARRTSANRDMKSALNTVGRKNIRWLWHRESLTPNALLQLDPTIVSKILAQKSGTKRVDALFRAAEGRIVHRSFVLTAARQLDGMRRLRGGSKSGARASLGPEGYLILSGAYHANLATKMGLPRPAADEFVSVRVAEDSESNGVLLGGRYWRRALPLDPVVAAPSLDT